MVTTFCVKELCQKINSMMEADKNWDLISVDSIEARHLGVNEHMYTAWLQYEKEV